MNRCTIAGCARAYRCSGYCAVHYDRARRGRSLADPPPPAKLSACSVDGCAASVVARGWCKVHYYRWKKMGRTELATRSVTYATAHRRVITARGPASGHRCVDCGGQAQEWSYNHADPNESVDRRGRPYSYDLNNYDPRCRGCHRLKDAAGEDHRGDDRVTRLRPRDAARVLHVSPRTLHKWAREGRLIRHPDGFELQDLLDAEASRNEAALLSRAGIKTEHRPARHLRTP